MNRRSTEHSTEAALEALAEGRPEEGPSPEEHLEEGCPHCATGLRRSVGRAMPGLRRLMRRSIVEGRKLAPEELGELARRTRAWETLGEAERRSAPELLETLLARPAAERRETIRRRPRFASYGLVHHLVKAARTEGFRDPSQALELARLAVEVAEVLEKAGYPAGIAADARALAWASVANAHRIPGELVDAERAMRSARRYLAEGTGDPGTRAEVLSLEGSLRIDEARFDDAVEVLQEAARIRRALEDRVGEGKVLVKLGNAAGEGGDPEQAASVLEAARERLGEGAPGELGVLAGVALAEWLRAAGRVPEAVEAWGRLREEIGTTRELSVSLQQRVDWAGARLAWSAGDRERAERVLRAVRDGYAEKDDHYRYCLVSLDLAILCLEDGRTAEVRDLAAEMVPVFASRQIHHHAAVALVVFQKAAEGDRVTVAVVQDVARYLRRAANNPYLAYEPAR